MRSVRVTSPGSAHAPALGQSDAALILHDVLAILRERRGIDFSDYRQATIERRIVNRMIATRVAGAGEYLDLLRNADLELDRLTANLTIKVSRFYRNAAVFDRLRTQLVPELIERFRGEDLRAWSAGCAAGEEPYTLAMIFEGDVYATDVDELALAAARRGEYRTEVFAEVPPSLVDTFVRPAGAGGALSVVDELRTRVRFLRHDLSVPSAIPGAPFHLICCRNVLIYFSRILQRRTMQLLIDNLVPGGVLCLGEAEWPADTSSLDTMDRKSRIFRRKLQQETAR